MSFLRFSSDRNNKIQSLIAVELIQTNRMLNYLLAKCAKSTLLSLITDRFLNEKSNGHMKRFWCCKYELNSTDLPFILVQPRIKCFFKVLSFKCNNVSALLARHPDLILLGLLVGFIFFSIKSLKNHCVLARDLRQKPSAGKVAILICDVHFKLYILIDNHGNNLRVWRSDNWL